MCSILSSSDIIAAVTLVKFEEQPKLFSVILGEGLFNDAVAVVLFQTMQKVFNEEDQEAAIKEGKFIPSVLVNFLTLVSVSVGIGLVFGLLASCMTKYMRFISHSAISESALFFAIALVSYYVGELLHMSAIVALLTTSIMLSHYAFYNLSPQGKHVTSVTFQTLGYMCEATVFAYVGIIFPQELTERPWCWKFVLVEFAVVIIGRFMAIFIAYFVFECCPGRPENKLTCNQLSFIAYAALIRGAIAFGLSQEISEKHFGLNATLTEVETV